MYIDINDLGDKPFAFDRRFHLPDESLEGNDGAEVDEVHLRGEATRGDRGVEFRATLDAAVRLRCSRCLEMYEISISSAISLIIVAGAADLGGGEVQLSAADLDLFHADEGKADRRNTVTVAGQRI